MLVQLPVGLTTCSSLEELDISANQLTKMPTLKHLKKLAILHVDENQLATLDSLKGLVSLAELYASNNNLTQLQQLPVCAGLEVRRLLAGCWLLHCRLLAAALSPGGCCTVGCRLVAAALLSGLGRSMS